MSLSKVVLFCNGLFIFLYSEFAIGNYSCCNTFTDTSPLVWIFGVVFGLILMAPLVGVLKKR